VKRITRDQLVETVAESLPYALVRDVPAIRMACNDTADSYRKDGYTVPDFSQDRLVKAVQHTMQTNALYLLENGAQP